MAIREIEKDPTGEQKAKRVRIVSTTPYPYFDHASSIKVADVIQNRGGGTCASDFLASALEYKTVKSGTFLTRIAAARMFGYITTSGGNFVVTERARKILSPVMPEDSINAKVEAFLGVPLFAKTYERFHGSQLPHEPGLKNLFQNTFGIVPDRVPQAVRVFLNSAEQCGFFHGGKGRLIRPIVNAAPASVITDAEPQNQPPSEPPPVVEKPRSGGGGSGSDGGGVHTSLIGLLRSLPGPGESWTEKEQKRFLAAFTHTIEYLYPANSEGQ